MEYPKIHESWGGVVAISILVILIIFAIFNSSKPKGKAFGTAAHPIEAEDLKEQQNANPRNITVKNGQKLVIF